MEYQNNIVQCWQMNGNDDFNRANDTCSRSYSLLSPRQRSCEGI